MKGWCKIIQIDGHDVLVERLVDKTNGEHVSVKFKVPEGQLVQLSRWKSVLNAPQLADEYFDEVDEELIREKFMPAFKHVIDDGEEAAEEKNESKD